MIVHVWRRAIEADVGPVVVAADDARIVEAVEAAGGKAVLTRAGPSRPAPTGFSRRSAASIPAGAHDIVVNVQGDLPTIERAAVRACLAPLADAAVDIATLATPITRARGEGRSQCRQGGRDAELAPGRLRALYFTRARAPWGEGELLHHIGLYAYRRAALGRFVALPPSPLERRERLEQLRALEAGMRIDVALVDTAPLGVDTPDDLERARSMLAPRKDR